MVKGRFTPPGEMTRDAIYLFVYLFFMQRVQHRIIIIIIIKCNDQSDTVTENCCRGT